MLPCRAIQAPFKGPAEIVIFVFVTWFQGLYQLQIACFHKQVLSWNMPECCLGQIQLTATSISGLPWAVLENLPHTWHISFISDMGMTRTLSLADAHFCFRLLIPCVNQLLLW